MDIKGEIYGNTVLAGNFNIPLTLMNITEETEKSIKMNQYQISWFKENQVYTRTLRLDYFQDILSKKPKIKKTKNKKPKIVFSRAHGIFSMTDHMLGPKTNVSKFKSIRVISRTFSDHNRMKQEINHLKRNRENNDFMHTKQHAT